MIDIIATLLRLFGFIATADKLVKSWEDKRQAQNIANAPTTDQEWAEDAKEGKL